VRLTPEIIMSEDKKNLRQILHEKRKKQMEDIAAIETNGNHNW